MAQYIPKDPLVAEIERLEKKNNESENVYDFGTEHALKSLRSFLRTLEVKEVDLEKEIDTWYQNKASKEFEKVFYEDIEDCAKYFFELGMAVSGKEQMMTKEL